jgi:hypothetical protein
METTQSNTLAATVLTAYADYFNSIKRPLPNVQITPGVKCVRIQKQYHVADTVNTTTSEPCPPVTMTKQFNIKIHKSGMAYADYFVYFEHDGHRLEDFHARLGRGWHHSDTVATRMVIKDIMAILRRNDARSEMIKAIITKVNESHREATAKIQSRIFMDAASVWNTPLPAGEKGTFDIPWGTMRSNSN